MVDVNTATPATPATKALPKIPKAVAEALLAAGKLDKATFDSLMAAGAVTSGQGFGGGDPVSDQLKELGIDAGKVDAFYAMRDQLHDAVKAKGYGVVIYLKHPKATATPVTETPAPVVENPAPATPAPKAKGKAKKS